MSKIIRKNQPATPSSIQSLSIQSPRSPQPLQPLQSPQFPQSPQSPQSPKYQYQQYQKVKLFESCQGYANGAQMRDFISVEDVVNVNLHFFNNHLNDIEEISGIFNCGTGSARSFNDLALATINACRGYDGLEAINLEVAVAQKIIEYIPFPSDLANKYQCFTEANIQSLRDAGYNKEFLALEEGVSRYIAKLK